MTIATAIVMMITTPADSVDDCGVTRIDAWQRFGSWYPSFKSETLRHVRAGFGAPDPAISVTMLTEVTK